MQKLVDQKWPNQIFPMVNFIVSHNGRLAHEGGSRGDGGSRAVLEERGVGSGTQPFVCQKWPNKIFATVNLVFSHTGHFGLGGGGLPPLLRWCTADLILPWGRGMSLCALCAFEWVQSSTRGGDSRNRRKGE